MPRCTPRVVFWLCLALVAAGLGAEKAPLIQARVVVSVSRSDGTSLLLDRGSQDGVRLGARGHLCRKHPVTVVELWRSRAKAHTPRSAAELGGCDRATFPRDAAEPPRAAVTATVVAWMNVGQATILNLDKGTAQGLSKGQKGTLCGKEEVEIVEIARDGSKGRTSAPNERLDACSTVVFGGKKPAG